MRLAGPLPGPTPRAALLLGVVALTAIVLPVAVSVLLALALAGAAVADARAARRPVRARREVSVTLARGVPVRLTAGVEAPHAGRVTVRQAAPAGIHVEPREAPWSLESTLVALQRGRHVLPPLAVRREGPLGLAAVHSAGSDAQELSVFPDLPAARGVALAVQSGRFRDEGHRSRGPLGLGTEFESVRDYSPDDDVRQVNWRATARLGRPMSNQYRVEQDRDLVFLLDAGRLMSGPLSDRTRLDAALDALCSVGLVADALGDRCGVVAFDARVLRELAPRRAGGAAAVRALFDLEPSGQDSDYEGAFQRVAGRKRSLVLVLTDILEETAARPLAEAVPVLARRHVVVVASAADDDLVRTAYGRPRDPRDAHAQAVALDVLDGRQRVSRSLAGAGADVLEAPAGELGVACVRAYLRAKSRARL